jgi:hypothetical protein
MVKGRVRAHHARNGIKDHNMNRSCRFYRSLRAVKVLLAALRSTLTVLAPRMGGLYRFRVADLSAAIAFSHAARRILASRAFERTPVSSLPNTAVIAQFCGILKVAKGRRTP